MSIEKFDIGDVARLKSNLSFEVTIIKITSDGESAICTYMEGKKPENCTLALAALTKEPIQRVTNFDLTR